MRLSLRTPWIGAALLVCLLPILTRLLGDMAVLGIEALALSLGLSTAFIWGVFHPRRVLAQGQTALRDALLICVAQFFLFRGLLSFVSTNDNNRLAELPLFGPLFLPTAAALLSVLSYPLVVGLNLTLVALAGMVFPNDSHAERSILPIFWPAFLLALIVDMLLKTVGITGSLWPRAGLTLISPFLSLLFLRQLRSQGHDYTSFTQRLYLKLQRRCTRRGARGLRDFRGLVLGGLVGLFSLAFFLPAFHTFVAPYDGVSYSAATQLANRVASLRLALEQRDQARALLPLLPHDASKQTALRDQVIITYDDVARHEALKTSEAALQTKLLRHLAAAKPRAIVLPLSVRSEMDPLLLSPETPMLATETPKRSNEADFPALSRAIQEARVVYLLPLWELKTNTVSESSSYRGLFTSAQKVASHRLTSMEAPELPALNLKATPTPLALLLTQQKRPLPRRDPLTLIDFRLDLAQVRHPIAASQILQNQSLYDPFTKSWTPAATFFKGKFVYIEPLNPRTVPTPLGLRGEVEVHAQAVATLLQKDGLRRFPPLVPILWTLALAALIGQLSVGRAPLESLWRIVPLLGVMTGLCIVVTAFTPYYVTPVVPLLAGVLSYLVVTQFTFAIERDERARNREILGRFVAPQAIEELLDDPEGKLGLGGKRRRIVVLFVDVRGFSGFAERRTPEEVVTTMNRYLGVMTDALNAHEGILDKYTGDGLMALFLVEEKTQAEDVLRAVRASQEMAEAVTQLAAQMRADGGDELAVGMGLHFGEAVVGMVGHPTRQINYTALGHTVVVAARLQTLASGGEIILSEAVYKALPPGTITGEAGESVQVKGVADPVPIYRLHVSSK